MLVFSLRCDLCHKDLVFQYLQKSCRATIQQNPITNSQYNLVKKNYLVRAHVQILKAKDDTDIPSWT